MRSAEGVIAATIWLGQGRAKTPTAMNGAPSGGARDTCEDRAPLAAQAHHDARIEQS
jgi:hypothetical protein